VEVAAAARIKVAEAAEVSRLSLLFAILLDTSEKWRGGRMKPYIGHFD